jgi:hypothetical protein
MRRWRTLLTSMFALGLLAATAACQDAGTPAGPQPVSLRVLFIGNSLTYYNDLPGTLADIARTAGDTLGVESVTGPGYALIDHLGGKSGAVAAVRRGGWDVVVLQQGPSTLAVNRDSLVLWTGMFDSIIRPAGAQTALYMVWPAGVSVAGTDAVRQSYQLAAQSVGGLFLPAGVALRLALQRDATLPLLGTDDFHPSPLGTYLVAITIYERLTGKDARGLPDRATANGAALGASAATVQLLQEAAHQANTQY